MKGTVFPSSNRATVRSTLSAGRLRSRARCPRSTEIVEFIECSYLPRTFHGRREATRLQRGNLARRGRVVKDCSHCSQSSGRVESGTRPPSPASRKVFSQDAAGGTSLKELWLSRAGGAQCDRSC